MHKLQFNRVEGVTINHDQKLYVIPCSSGFTCCGFEYADKQARAVALWTGDTAPTAALGTLEHFYQYSVLMELGAKKHARTGERCNADLIPEFIGREKSLVEVVRADDEKTRFIIGKSSGWFPCHLELSRRTSRGGDPVTGLPFKSIRFLA